MWWSTSSLPRQTWAQNRSSRSGPCFNYFSPQHPSNSSPMGNVLIPVLVPPHEFFTVQSHRCLLWHSRKASHSQRVSDESDSRLQSYADTAETKIHHRIHHSSRFPQLKSGSLQLCGIHGNCAVSTYVIENPGNRKSRKTSFIGRKADSLMLF